MIQKLIFATFLMFSANLFARGMPAHRPSHLSSDYIQSYYESQRTQRKKLSNKKFYSKTALDKKKYAKQSWEYAPEITESELRTIFQIARDEKVLVDNQKRSRRATWLYPDDGCFARAELVTRILEKRNLPLPAKIFAFGDLGVDTKNHPDGYISWWYHVASLYRANHAYYVIDPAIESSSPLKVEDWLKRMNKKTQPQVAVCKSHTYDPGSPCDDEQKEQTLNDPIDDESGFLEFEWERLIELNRNPEKELGDFPPWAASA